MCQRPGCGKKEAQRPWVIVHNSTLGRISDYLCPVSLHADFSLLLLASCSDCPLASSIKDPSI